MIDYQLYEGLSQLNNVFLRCLHKSCGVSSKHLLNEKDSPTHLKKNVTSKGGTTEAALKILENKNGLSTLISKAIDKAKKRSRELSKAN